ncbi:hypothetical protein, partial [Saccharopolyspora sp. NPDC003762]
AISIEIEGSISMEIAGRSLAEGVGSQVVKAAGKLRPGFGHASVPPIVWAGASCREWFGLL